LQAQEISRKLLRVLFQETHPKFVEQLGPA